MSSFNRSSTRRMNNDELSVEVRFGGLKEQSHMTKENLPQATDEAFHRSYGGNIRQDRRKKYLHSEKANETRGLMVWLKGKTGMTESEIATLIRIGRSTISMAAGGRAGERNINRRKYSTSEAVKNRLNFIYSNQKLIIPILNAIVLPVIRFFK